MVRRTGIATSGVIITWEMALLKVCNHSAVSFFVELKLTNHLDQHIAENAFEAKSGSGSLLSTSESDGWSGRPQVPWSTFNPAGSLSFGQHNVGPTPAQTRPNDRSAPALSEATDTTSYFKLPRSSGRGSSSATGSHKPFLTGSDGISPGDGMSFGFSGFKNGEGRRPSAFGGSPMGTGLAMNGGLPGALDTPRSDDMSGSMMMSALSSGVADMPQPLTRGCYAHTSHNSASFHPRPVHSATTSFHSESQGFDGRYGSSPMDISAGLNKLQINDGGYPPQSVAQRPPYLSQASYDASFNGLKYPSATDGGSFQNVAGYGVESTPDLPLAYRINKSQVGDFDPITPSEYAPMASPFYAVDNSATTGLHYRNGSGRLSDGQAAAVERKLRGFQEQDYAQHSVNPLQRLQFSQAYDLAGYQAARLNALSGFYPVAHLGGLGATAMVSRSRDHDPAQVVRSPLLEEFRANSKGNKRYELKVRTRSSLLLACANSNRTYTTMWSSSVVTSTDHASFNRN